MVALLICFAAPSLAVNKTVKAGGGGDFTTIQSCATAMAAGDSCTVYAGTYNENVSVPAGTAGNYKTITVNGSDVVSVVGEFTLNSHTKLVGNCGAAPQSLGTCGFSITGVTALTAPCVLVPDGATDIFITSNVMKSCGSGGQSSIIWIGGSSTGASFIYVQGNTLSYGCGTVASPDNCTGIWFNGANHVLAENNDLSHFGLSLQNFAQYSVIRNNAFHDMNESECGAQSGNCHLDIIYSERSVTTASQLVQYNLWEGNTGNTITGVDGKGLWTAADNPSGCGTSCFNVIGRFNVLAHFGSATTVQSSGFLNVKFYNNSIIDPNNYALGSPATSGPYIDDTSTGGSSINNLYYYPQSVPSSWGWYAYSLNSSGAATGFTAGANLAYCTSTPCQIQTLRNGTSAFAFASDTPVIASNILAASDPLASYSGGNFNLASGSPAIAAGTYLTTVASGDSGSGTSLVVTDAGFFQDGLGLNAAGVHADCISITTVSNHICITAVNYSTNTLTMASGFSRSVGDHIWLYSKSDGAVVLTGTAPDMGAYPFATSNPVVSLSPASLAFGRQLVTTSSAGLTTTLTNVGGAVLSISSIALNTGTQYAITANTCGSTLAASFSCAVTVVFTPTTLGAKSDSIVFTTNAASSPDSVPLTGAGIPFGQVFDWNVPTSNQLCTNSNTSTGITTPAFIPSFNYNSVRYWVQPTVPNGHFYKVTTIGVASTEPSWPTGAGSTVTTGGTTFTEQGGTNAGECKDEFFLYVLPNIDGAALGFNVSDLDPSNGGCTAQAGGGYTFSTMDSTITGFTGATEWGAQNSVVLVFRPGTYTSSNSWTPCYWLSPTYAATLSAPTNNVCFCAGYPGDKPSTTNACFTTGADTTGVAVPFDVPFKTGYNAFLAADVAHLKGSSYHSFINYTRFGEATGGETFPFCASQMKVAYSYSTAQLKTAWTGQTKVMADQILAATPNFGVNAGVNGLCVPGPGTCVVGYDWADLEASYYVADGFGIGSEGLTQADINAFANNGYAAGGTAATSGTYCSNDFCYNFHANPAALPLELQTGTASNPTGAGTGSLVNLLSFATQQQATSAEIYNQDLMIAYNPNYPQYSTYHVAYAAAIQAFRSSTPAATSVPNGIYGASKVSGQVIIQ